MQYVLITGASSGIGAATARLFSERGYGVLLSGRNLDRLQAVQRQLPSPSHVIQADLSLADQRDALIQKVLQQNEWSEGLRVLVNNAGIFHRASVKDLDLIDFHKQIEVNYMAPVHLMKGLQPILAANAPAAVVNISSTLGDRPVPLTAHYGATKAALDQFTRVAALEWAAQNIRVNAVAPGIVDTPIHGLDSLSEGERANTKAQMAKMHPLGRMGTPEQIAEAVFFLAGELSQWTTGVVLPVDGGISLL